VRFETQHPDDEVVSDKNSGCTQGRLGRQILKASAFALGGERSYHQKRHSKDDPHGGQSTLRREDRCSLRGEPLANDETPSIIFEYNTGRNSDICLRKTIRKDVNHRHKNICSSVGFIAASNTQLRKEEEAANVREDRALNSDIRLPDNPGLGEYAPGLLKGERRDTKEVWDGYDSRSFQ